MKRISIILALTLALCLAFVGSAYANAGPHGGYVTDTDSCAGCHRAHTSFSTLTWTDVAGDSGRSALLVGSASTMTEFCEACHGDCAPGASTNVASGIFDSGPTGASNVPTGTSVAAVGPADVDNQTVVTQYLSGSVFNAPLNGGGFNRMPDPYAWQSGAGVVYKTASSAHKMDVSGPLWGSGSAVSSYGGSSGLTCTDCHDPHGNSNYRLLKGSVNSKSVGGYQADGETPAPFVLSNEVGYPVPVGVGNPGGGIEYGAAPLGGWLKHDAGGAQMADYRPNYTDTTGTPLLNVNPGVESMSVWCAACHQNYNQITAGATTAYKYNPYIPAPGFPSSSAQLDTKNYHRHAIDITVAGQAGLLFPDGTRTLAEAVLTSATWIPLENPGAGVSGYMGCLTCHRAHGSSVEMTGWAASHLETMSVNTTGSAHDIYMPVRDSVAGVDPSKGTTDAVHTQGVGTSALLRANNRGVCERCHNK